MSRTAQSVDRVTAQLHKAERAAKNHKIYHLSLIEKDEAQSELEDTIRSLKHLTRSTK